MAVLNRDNYPMMVIYYLPKNTWAPHLDFFKVKKMQVRKMAKSQAVAVVMCQKPCHFFRSGRRIPGQRRHIIRQPVP